MTNEVTEKGVRENKKLFQNECFRMHNHISNGYGQESKIMNVVLPEKVL